MESGPYWHACTLPESTHLLFIQLSTKEASGFVIWASLFTIGLWLRCHMECLTRDNNAVVRLWHGRTKKGALNAVNTSLFARLIKRSTL